MDTTRSPRKTKIHHGNSMFFISSSFISIHVSMIERMYNPSETYDAKATAMFIFESFMMVLWCAPIVFSLL